MFRRAVFALVSLALLSGCAGPQFNPVSPATVELIRVNTNLCGEGDQDACARARAARDMAYVERFGAPQPDPGPGLGLALLGVAAMVAGAVIDEQQPTYVIVRRCRWC